MLTVFNKGQEIFNSANERRNSDGNSLNQNQIKVPKGSRWKKPGDHAKYPQYISGGGQLLIVNHQDI